MMRAIQLRAPGDVSQLKLVDLPVPVATQGQVLIRVKAFGINRSEILTRKHGRAPVGPVQLPRVLGVEAAGTVESAPGHEQELPTGSVVMTAVGGMGIAFDGGYAEYTCVAYENVQLVRSEAAEKLGWQVLGALPVMLQTAHGSLSRCLKLARGESLLIRGGTTSVGVAAAAIAKSMGATVVVTTRKTDDKTTRILKENGADNILIDNNNSIRERLLEVLPGGVDKVLELVGASTLADSLACLKDHGICCYTGLVGGSTALPEFNPLFAIRTGQYLTAYAERSFHKENFPLDDLIGLIMDGSLKIKLGPIFGINQIHQAHEVVEGGTALGKVVVLTEPKMSTV